MIIIDDLRPELNCYGANHIKSPNIDRLSSEGIQFNQAHVQQAICMASRASILTGVRPEKRGIYTGESVTKLLPEVLSINNFFKQEGYNIAAVGKVYHHGEDTQNQFGNDYIVPTSSWTGRGYVSQESIDKIKLNTTHNRGPAYEAANVHDTLYKDGINTLNAIRKLDEFQQSDQPFFMAVGLTKPHLPFVAPQKYWDMYPPESIDLTDLKERPKNTSEHTIRFNGELTNYYGIPAKYTDIDDSTALILRRAYYACVSYADAQVGLLMDKLDQLGIRDETIIVLWGDHGFKLGDYDSWCKWSNMYLDTHIPLIVSAPKLKRGIINTSPTEAINIYPTLAELAGLKKPNHLEGNSLAPYLNNPSLHQEDTIFTIWPHNRWNYDKTIMGFSAKTTRFNYTEWVKLSTGEVVERELYDHENDHQETFNVIGDIQYADDIQRMAYQVEKLKANTDHDHAFKNLR
ncbi:MAG: sulfatase [Cyclobacteriaceae bacterium]